VAPKEIVCTILETIPEMNEPARKVVLGLSLLKHSAKFDIVVEKAVELGVSAIIPIVAEHSERHRGKTERWKDIATSAAKQSLRCRIPEIDEPKNLEDACVREPFGAIAIAHELAPTEQSFGHFLEKRLGEHGSLLVLIGPEGGFTEQECKTAESLGAERVSLGTRRLRSETAAILAVGLATAILESRRNRLAQSAYHWAHED
jgi:16S rRNA (uracil1498-N3)-methyltransferase